MYSLEITTCGLIQTSRNWGAHIYPKSAQSVSMTEEDTE